MSPSISAALLSGLLALLPALSVAQVCKPDSIPATTPTAQFTAHGNGTVTDTKTALMWKQCPEGQSGADCSIGRALYYSWEQALAHVETLNASGGFAGYTDWRLPNIKELASLVEEQCDDPAINSALFPNTASELFWSSSPVVYDKGNTWMVYFGRGSNVNWPYWVDAFLVRLVRDQSCEPFC